MSVKVDEFSGEKFSYIQNADSNSICPKHEFFSYMLLWLRGAAVDPCNLKWASEKVRRTQILKAREVIFLSSTEFPWKKRKVCLVQGRSSSIFASSLEKPNEQSSFASSVSCLINGVHSIESSGRVLRNPPSSARSVISHENLSRKRVCNSRSFEYDDSNNGSYPSSIRKTNFRALHDSLPLKRMCMSQADPMNESFPTFVDSDDDSINSSNKSSLQNPKQHKTPRRSLRFLNFIGDYIPRLAIPVGPRFQADIPDWTGPLNRENSKSSGDEPSNSDNSRWLGTRIWPIKGKNSENSRKGIGKGRTHSCSCSSSGSIRCIKRHLFEKRRHLRADLGSAFFSWRFDEMGEEVSKSWTLTEQKSFNILLKKNSICKSKSFLKHALKHFSCKCRKSIVSYYFNVFVLRRMSKQNRSTASVIVDSDDDDEASDQVSSSRPKRAQYLIRCR